MVVVHEAPALFRLVFIFAVVTVLLPISGCVDTEDKDEVDVTVLTASPSLVPRNTGTGEVHDATLVVNKVTPRDVTVKWSDISVVIKAADGSVLLPMTSVKEDTSTYGAAVEVWYSDTTGKRDRLDAGDEILITGMEASVYEGGWVYVFHEDNRVSDTTLPTDFP